MEDIRQEWNYMSETRDDTELEHLELPLSGSGNLEIHSKTPCLHVNCLGVSLRKVICSLTLAHPWSLESRRSSHRSKVIGQIWKKKTQLNSNSRLQLELLYNFFKKHMLGQTWSNDSLFLKLFIPYLHHKASIISLLHPLSQHKAIWIPFFKTDISHQCNESTTPIQSKIICPNAAPFPKLPFFCLSTLASGPVGPSAPWWNVFEAKKNWRFEKTNLHGY